ncbi:MAG: Calx-beta domain-containing protein [Acidimicrobiales bacterium]|nr:Calx-beta domain-containing protein [Acidimicrobiales bacterium]
MPVTLSAPSGQTITVEWTTTDTAQPEPGIDYTPASGTLTFLPGETDKSVPVTVHGDVVDEVGQLWNAEWGTVAFSSPTNTTFGAGALASTGLFLIVDDDPAPTIKPGVGGVVEGDDGDTIVEVPVELSASSDRTITVDWSTADTDQPEPGVDFAAASGTVRFEPGETSKTVPVAVHGDTEQETGTLWRAEWGSITFTNPSNAGFADGTSAATGLFLIVDDDDVTGPLVPRDSLRYPATAR